MGKMDLKACKTLSKCSSQDQESMMMIDSPWSDLTSKLPDEILIDILSRLSMKEAARTSVVSHRWESLWKFYHGCMDFEDLKTRKLVTEFKLRFEMGQRKYVNWVNQVLGLHQGGRTPIEQLRVHFQLDKADSSCVDSWIGFVASRGVRRFELDFSSMEVVHSRSHIPALERYYDLPTPITDFLSKFRGDFKQLISLRLSSVNVADEHVSYFLCNCLFLEELCFVNILSLRNLKLVAAGVGGRALRLKHLEITNCVRLQRLEVLGATNLVSLMCDGPITVFSGFQLFEPERRPPLPSMLFQDVPQLSSVSFGSGDFTLHLVNTGFRELPFPIAQLQALTMDLNVAVPAITHYLFPHQEFTAHFTNLRQLELAFQLLDKQSMLFVGLFLHASPALQKLVLKYEIIVERQYLPESETIRFNDQYRQLVQGLKCERLKEVEFCGWIGLNSDLELATHLLEAAAGSLERVKVDPRDPFSLRWGFDYETLSPDERAPLEDARNRARDLLEPKLSPTTKLLVL